MTKILALAGALALVGSWALAQTLFPNQLAPYGLSGGGGQFTPPQNIANDANAVILTDDAGVRLQAQ
jgi:hypothetical protein